jgi:outer membrane receptor protein involved in Fe transport
VADNYTFTSITGLRRYIGRYSMEVGGSPTTPVKVGMQYVLPLGTAGSVTARLDANYQSDFFTDISNSALGHVGGRTLANARITWKSMLQDWETAVAVTNLTDHFYYINKVFGAAPPTSRQASAAVPSNPNRRA